MNAAEQLMTEEDDKEQHLYHNSWEWSSLDRPDFTSDVTRLLSNQQSTYPFRQT